MNWMHCLHCLNTYIFGFCEHPKRLTFFVSDPIILCQWHCDIIDSRDASASKKSLIFVGDVFSKCHYYAFVVLVTSPQKMKYWKIPERMSSCAKRRCRVNLRTFERYKGETIIILGWFFAFEITIELWIQKLMQKLLYLCPVGLWFWSTPNLILLAALLLLELDQK